MVFNWKLLWDSIIFTLLAASKDEHADEAQRRADTRPRVQF